MKINACGKVRHDRKEMPPNFSPKHLWLKRRHQSTGKCKGCVLEGQTRSLCPF
jgi:hypothetical protein